eukprot:8203797-Pyramimonas_sp.AAC.1
MPWGNRGPCSRHLGPSWCPCLLARAVLEARDAYPQLLTRDVASEALERLRAALHHPRAGTRGRG